MDERVSTAPSPKSKKWVSKNAGGAFLLRQPSDRNPSDPHSDDVSAAVDRPHTCPSLTLTPEFHWNLNNSALKTLSTAQIEQLYGLFKFYDSSTVGDKVPSINCPRFLEILRDARLLSDEIPLERTVEAASAERIFAQATLGKMRVYLDTNQQPTLTFSLFCGALMNSAMLLHPLIPPEVALQRILPFLLDNSVVESNAFSPDRSLLDHVSSESVWTPGKSQVVVPQLEYDQLDFRELPMFQAVMEDCANDIDLEEQKYEELTRLQEIPSRLVASFHPETIAHISNKFRVFDVFDRGALPRSEIFALLSSVGSHENLPDPHAVITRLNDLPLHRVILQNGTSTAADTEELTLPQLLQVIENTRESKRHSGTAQLASMKVRMDRTAVAARGSLHSKQLLQEATVNDGNENVDTQDTPVLNKRKSRGSLRRRQATAGLKSSKLMLGQGAEASSNSILDSKLPGSISGRKRTVVYRRRSSLLSGKGDDHHEDVADEASPMKSQRSATSNYNRDLSQEASTTDGTGDHFNNYLAQTLENRQEFGAQLLGIPSTTAVQMNTLTTKNTKTIRLYLLLGGEHDGAIYCTLTLRLKSREIVENEGIYYSTAPNETTRTTPVLPTQHNLMNALEMVKKRVQTKVEQGFELRPAGQLAVVDGILQDLQKHLPHFTSPVTKTTQNSAALTLPQHAGVVPFLSISHERLPKLPPHSKAGHPRLQLPSNFTDLCAKWDISQHENYAWIHDIKAASPLKSPAQMVRAGHLSPLCTPIK